MNTIRKNPIILLISIGLAMAGFILMDMMTSGGPASANQFTLGKVNGQRIDWQVFSDTETRLFGNSGADVFQRKQQLWNYFVEKILIDDIAEDLGLGVGKEELVDLEFGTNLSPIIQRNFMDPNTRQVDRQQLNSLRQAIDADQLPPDLRVFWAEQEKEIVKDRLQAKLVAMVAKGMYLPTWQAEMMNKDRAMQSEVAYVRIPFDAVADSDVAVSEEDRQPTSSRIKRCFIRTRSPVQSALSALTSNQPAKTPLESIRALQIW
ncbi:MAG: SurA N-terminal domain-containing protein [Saprospiraceae bacterium]|nr:SurA N-terminal domain-containing protein [Saprospiraceae bacterium]